MKKNRIIRYLLLLIAALFLNGCRTGELVWQEASALSPGTVPENSTPRDDAPEAGIQQDNAPEDGTRQEAAPEAGPAKDDAGGDGSGKESREEETAPADIAVFVCGAVAAPGVYYFPEGSRVVDAIEAAGGFAEDTDREWINQAGLLEDGARLKIYTVPEVQQMKEEEKAPDSDRSFLQADTAVPGDEPLQDDTSGDSGKVNLNTATKEELMTLPGIGASRAEKILSWRAQNGGFSSTEDILQISGIGSAIFREIQNLICV